MKKVLVILALLAVSGIASAVVVDGATWAPTSGWMNVQNSTVPESWGSGWGLDDVRTTGAVGNWSFQTNVNAADDNYANWSTGTDMYWAPGNDLMEGLSYTESGWGEFTGQDVTFNFVIGSNNLGGALDANGDAIVTEAFIKVLDAGASWGTGQEVYEPMTVGAHSFTLYDVGSGGATGYLLPMVQVGFRVISANDVSGSATADLSAVLVPEPATMALLGLGGLLLRRRK